MKIALVILHADRARGGAETYTLDLAGALASRGHEVTIASASFGDIDPRVRRLPLVFRGATRTGRYRAFLSDLDARMTAGSFDIVHAMLPVRRCDVYHPHAGLAIDAVAKFKVANLLNPRRWMFARVEQELIRSAKPVVLALSEYVKRGIRRHYDIPDSRLPVLFNAVDLERFTLPAREIRSDAGHAFVSGLIVAQDFERKGLATVLRAMASIEDQRLRLVVVGRPDPAKYRRLAASLGVADRVTFAGAVTDVVPYYHSSDFFVLPTKHDPCSLVVLEALATGLPVISTRMNGACEIMRDTVHGFVLDEPDNVFQLAGAIKQLMVPERVSEMRAACEQLRPALSYETHVNSLIEIYQSILRARLRPGGVN